MAKKVFEVDGKLIFVGTPRQAIRVIYGLRGEEPYEATLVMEFGPLDLMMMDAPETIPGGSICFKGDEFCPWVGDRIVLRGEMVSFRQGGELWRDGHQLHTALESFS